MFPLNAFSAALVTAMVTNSIVLGRLGSNKRSGQMFVLTMHLLSLFWAKVQWIIMSVLQ